MNQFMQFIGNHWELSLAFVVLLILTLVNELIGKRHRPPELSPQLVVDMMNNNEAVVVDIRDKESFKKGHIIDSINAKPDDFNEAKMNKYKGKPIILICSRGIQAASVASKLKTQGFKTMILSGGITSWQNADLPLVKNKG
jgi:rhodanese-related sulfurtransferase